MRGVIPTAAFVAVAAVAAAIGLSLQPAETGPRTLRERPTREGSHPRPVRRWRDDAVHADHRRHRGRGQGPARPAARPRRQRHAGRSAGQRHPHGGSGRARPATRVRTRPASGSTPTPGRTALRSATRCSRASTSETSSRSATGTRRSAIASPKRVEVDGYSTYDPFYALGRSVRVRLHRLLWRAPRARRLGQANDLVRRARR